jgi:hypothetical protein
MLFEALPFSAQLPDDSEEGSSGNGNGASGR